MKRQRLISICAFCVWLCGCGGDYAKAPPPPAPPPPAPPAAPTPSAPEPAAAPEPEAPPAPASTSKAERTRADKAGAKRSAKASAPTPSKASAATPAAKPAAPAPAKPAPAPAAKPAGKVSVPSTAHVRIEVPGALQAELDRDPRMQPWVNQVMAVIDRCYNDAARGGALAGTIEVVVTMHENDRPDADIKALPPQLSPIVACATGGLMRTKMPLFTGAEGGRRTVRIVFK
ncbi:MAG TPA: hypothetical protein VFZ61_33970 [Polyangiales bacterium]